MCSGKLCENCGELVYLDLHHQAYICNNCRHIEYKQTPVFTKKQEERIREIITELLQNNVNCYTHKLE